LFLILKKRLPNSSSTNSKALAVDVRRTDFDLSCGESATHDAAIPQG